MTAQWGNECISLSSPWPSRWISGCSRRVQLAQGIISFHCVQITTLTTCCQFCQQPIFFLYTWDWRWVVLVCISFIPLIPRNTIELTSPYTMLGTILTIGRKPKSLGFLGLPISLEVVFTCKHFGIPGVTKLNLTITFNFLIIPLYNSICLVNHSSHILKSDPELVWNLFLKYALTTQSFISSGPDAFCAIWLGRSNEWAHLVLSLSVDFKSCLTSRAA